MTHWVVDGMNVIGSRPDGWWRDRPAAMRRLHARLEALATSEGDTVTLFLDGRPRALAPGHVEVHFAPGGRDAADDALVAWLQGRADAGELVAVTSDGALAARVRAAGARVHGARLFLDRLDRLPA